MVKKREDRENRKRLTGEDTCDLDNGFVSPRLMFQDFTVENIKNIIRNSRYVQLLSCLTLIGFFLRFYHLGFNSLWLDEASTYTFASMTLPGIWQATTSGEFNPPLFYWMEHLMLALGNNEVILRFIPALLGGLTVPLVYSAGKEFVDRNVGIIAAAACAFSPFLIYYSQEARAYSVMLFFVIFAMVFFLRALKTDDTKDWVLFGVLSALAFWSHFYALVIIGALVLYALAVKLTSLRKDIGSIKPMIIAGAVFVVVCLPLILVTIQLFAKRTASAPTFGIQGLGIISETFQQISGFSDLAMILFLILFIVGICQAFLIDKNKGLFLVSLTVLTFVISYFLSYKIPMEPRYLIFLTPVFFIGIALCYKPLWNLFRNPAVIYGLMVLVVIVGAPVLVNMYSGYTKDDWRGFAGQVQQATNPGDFVVLIPGYISQPFNYYYSNTSDRTFEYGAYTAADLDAIAAQKTNNTIYYIITGDIMSADPKGDAIAWLNNNTKPYAPESSIALRVSA
ncbi:glycosyltransferase family 39 protein [Methanoregula sp.]|uniref:glycosyltransferase family 39 protein n=1 Tax=Methanoregula sp. TaxID=2052170 RepID=UPI003C737169